MVVAEQIGIVVAVEGERFARVLTDRKGACGGCQSNPDGCRGCLSSAKMESRVANPIGAGAGDLVKVHLAPRKLLAGAAILYLLPVAALLGGAFAGTAAASTLGVSELTGALGGAALGLVAGFLAVIGLDRSQGIRRHLTPRITTVVSAGVGVPPMARPRAGA